MRSLLQRAGSQLPALFAGLCVALAAAAAPGELDPTFGNGGKVDITLGQSGESVDRVLVQPDGKIVAVGTSNFRLALARYDASGALDPGFGSGGMFTISDGTSTYTTGALLQPSGKIVVMAFCMAESSRCLLRFNADGTPDTGFGSGGRMLVSDGGGTILALAQGPDGKIVGSLANHLLSAGPFGAFRASADGVLDSSFGSGGYATVAAMVASSGVAVQGDGKVIVTGHRFPSGFMARRFGVDGSEDTAFSAAFDANVFPEQSEAFAGAVQPDGKILIAGCTPLSPMSINRSLAIVRVLPTGALDPGFGSGTGIVHMPTPNRCARSISVRPDGRIVMAASSHASTSFDSQLEAVQLLPDGSPDPAFGSGGHAILAGDGASQPARDAALQSDGKLVIGGARYSRDFAVGRMAPDGSADATFGNGGIVSTEFWGGRRTTFREFARAPQGKAVALVQLEDVSSYGAPVEGEVALVRLLADGSLDSTFGVGGKAYGSLYEGPAPVISEMSVSMRAHAIAVQSDQKVLVGGLGYVQGVRGPVVMRFNADGTLDTSFGISGRRWITSSEAGESEGVHALRVQGDGSIVVVGKVRSPMPATYLSFVARLMPNGGFDSTFSYDGVVFFTPSDSSMDARLKMGLVLQPDGRIVVSGLENNRFSAFRLLADGSLDPEFFGSGMVVLPPPPAPGGQPYRLFPRGVALHLGSVVMFATAEHPTGTYNFSPAVARVGPSGTIFPTLAGGGPIVFKDLPGEVDSGAIDSAGRLVLAGSTTNATLNLDALWRFNEAGAPDTLFGAGGMVDTALGDCALGGLAIEPDDDMLVGCAGTNHLSFVAARVKGGGPSSFSRPADIDNDGIPDGIEWLEGRDAATRDNDVFGSAHLFAMQQYRDFLAREGDPGGVNFWEGEVSSGRASRGQMIESFFGSPEFQGAMAPVARLYFAYFLRIPDYSGLNFWIQYYRDGHSLDEISNFFVGSSEFQAMYGALDNAAFVNLIYQNVLGRAPDPGGFAFWKGQLDNGIRTRGQVMLGFSESDEYRGSSDSMVYVTMMYFGMLRRAPEQGGFDFWVGYRNAGNSGLALIDAFLGSPEYRSRFLP